MIDRSMLWIGWVVIGVVAFNVVPVTRLVYSPQTVDIQDGQVVMQRAFPMDALGLPRPRLSYTEVVRPLTQSHNGGRLCEDAGGPFLYGRAEPLGVWRIDWAADCIDDPLGFVWTARWTWHIGEIKAGSTSMTHTVLHSTPEKETSHEDS